METENDEKDVQEEESKSKPFRWEVDLRLDPDYPMDWKLRW